MGPTGAAGRGYGVGTGPPGPVVANKGDTEMLTVRCCGECAGSGIISQDATTSNMAELDRK